MHAQRNASHRNVKCTCQTVHAVSARTWVARTPWMRVLRSLELTGWLPVTAVANCTGVSAHVSAILGPAANLTYVQVELLSSMPALPPRCLSPHCSAPAAPRPQSCCPLPMKCLAALAALGCPGMFAEFPHPAQSVLRQCSDRTVLLCLGRSALRLCPDKSVLPLSAVVPCCNNEAHGGTSVREMHVFHYNRSGGVECPTCSLLCKDTRAAGLLVPLAQVFGQPAHMASAG